MHAARTTPGALEENVKIMGMRILGLAAAILGVVVAAVVLLRPDSADVPRFAGQSGEFIAFDRPRPVPETAFTDMGGAPVAIADFRGRVVVLNFWATWCAPCVKEMPSLDRLAAEMPDVAVLAASVDIKGAEIVAPFLEAHKIERLSILLDPKAGGLRGFGFRGLPSTIVIDREGRARGKLEGAAEWDSAEAKALLRFYADER